MKNCTKCLLLLSCAFLAFVNTVGCPSGTPPATAPNQNPPAIAAPARTPPVPVRTPAPTTPATRPTAPAPAPTPQSQPGPQAQPQATPQAPTPVPPAPAHVALSSSPSYCQAMLSTAQANELTRFVVETYNKRMSHIPGFKRAQINTSGEQPVVTFANPATPNLYYPKKGSNLHTTLCNAPGSPFFLCSNTQLMNSAAAAARSPNPISAYINYYEKEISRHGYTYDAPQEFGPLFVSLPLRPSELQNSQGQVVSGVLHVSIVKVWTSNQTNPETPTSAGLRTEFIRALKQEFANQQALLPSSLNFSTVRCLP